MAKQTEVRTKKEKVWVVSIVEYKANENYLDSYTELYADEQQAKARVDEYSTKAIEAAPEHDGLDDGGELVGEQGYVTWEQVARECLSEMSEADVEDMCNTTEWVNDSDFEEEEND